MEKVLVVVHLGRHLRLFSHSDAKIYHELGFEVHVASNYDSVQDKAPNYLEDIYKLHQISFSRSPVTISNLKAYFQLKKLIKQHSFKVVHTNMAIAGVIGRLAARKTKDCIIIHTSHGFSFYKNGSILKNAIFKSIEYFMARYTNLLITMNSADYIESLKMQRVNKNLNVHKINGVGVDLTRFNHYIDNSVKSDFEMPANKKLIVTVGELTKRKNQIVLLKAMKLLNNDFHLLICGRGILDSKLKKYVERNYLDKKVSFLGFRKDIDLILKKCSLFVFSSLSEGLPVSIMEAMASGLPVIASNVRGNSDIIVDGINGYLINHKNYEDYAKKIEELFFNVELMTKMRDQNLRDVQRYSIELVSQDLKDVYGKQINDTQ